MKKMQLGLMGFAAVLLFVPSIVRGAPIIIAGIDNYNFDVPTFFYTDDPTRKHAGEWQIGDGPDYPGFSYQVGDENGDGGSVSLTGELDPDPNIAFGITAVDFGAPSSFTFSFILPILPNVSNPTSVFDSLSGSVTNGAAGGSVTVTALAPPAGIPTDGDPATELQVYTLSDDGGATYKNVGLDAGPSTVIPLGSFASGLYPTFNQGPIATIAGGPWTHMRVDVNFMLSGGGDSFTLNGAKDLTPEPSACVLALSAIAFGWLFRRRS